MSLGEERAALLRVIKRAEENSIESPLTVEVIGKRLITLEDLLNEIKAAVERNQDMLLKPCSHLATRQCSECRDQGDVATLDEIITIIEKVTACQS